VDFVNAAHLLASRYGIIIPETQNKDQTPESKKRTSLRERLYTLHQELSTDYSDLLFSENGKNGLNYLKNRGFAEDIIKNFMIGFAPDSWDFAIKEAKQKGVLTVGIINVIGSSIAREVDAGIYNHAGPEIGVAASKSLAGMLKKLCKQNKVKLYIPPMVVCLDNGVIIADLGLKYYLHNKTQTLEETVSNAKFRTDQAVVYW